MTPQDPRWMATFIIAVLTLIIAVGWLDVVRGRELAVLRADTQWIIREMIRLHEDVEFLKRENRNRGYQVP